MKNVKIYPGQTESAPLEEYAHTGSVHDFFLAQGVNPDSKDVQPVACYVNGVFCEDWRGAHVGADDLLEIRPNPKAAIPAWVMYAIMAVTVVASFAMRPKMGGRNTNQAQGRNLNTAEANANVARLNQPIPELIGRFKRYPDYLVPPHRYFVDQRTQYLETVLCIGPGEYDIEQVRIGNTPFSELDGAEYTIHGPGAPVLLPDNWYSAPEVGPTSGGTAGLDLTAIAASGVNPPDDANYALNGHSITFPGSVPQSWGLGTSFELVAAQSTTVGIVNMGQPNAPKLANTFLANWDAGSTAAGQMVTAVGSVPYGDYLVGDVLPDGSITLMYSTGTENVYVNSLSEGTHLVGISNKYSLFQVTAINDASHTVTVTSNIPGWIGFNNRYASVTKWATNPDTVFGESIGPYYACPVNERTKKLGLDFFFPQGLHEMNDSGDVLSRAVGVEISYRVSDASPAVTRMVTYTAATLDQIGFTEVLDIPEGRPLVRIRRRGARSTDTRVQDVVQWYGLRALLRSPTRYAGVTTMSVRVKGLGQISSNSENQINTIATRKLPRIDGSYGPTRDISAAALHILRNSQYPADNIGMQAMRDLHALWTARGEYADTIFDGGTVGDALDAVFQAGMAERTIEHGKLIPVRESVRTIADNEQVFSAENNADFSRSFEAVRPDGNDGVEVEYQDATDGFAAVKVVCKLPDSPGVKLERIKLPCVTDRTQAWRIGMRRAREQRYRMWSYAWDTELDARNASYKGYVLLVPEITTMGQSAIIAGVSNGVVYLGQDLVWSGLGNVFGLRDKEGRFVGPFPAVRHADNAIKTNISVTPGDVLFFGTAKGIVHEVLTTKISPSGNKTTAQGVNYDARVYADDDNTPE